MQKKITTFFLSLQLFYSLNLGFVFASSNDDVEIEATYVKGNRDNWFARGEVIVKKPDLLLNAEEVNGGKDLQIDKYENQPDYSVDDLLKKGKVDDNLKMTKATILEAKEDVKIRMENDTLLYSKTFFDDERSGTGRMKNAQIFPPEPREHTMLYATQIDKKNNIYDIKQNSLCLCNIFTDKNLKKIRNRSFNNITADDEVILLPNGKNSIQNTDEEMHNYTKKTPLSIQAKVMTYDANEQLLVMRHAIFRILGVPFFYLPYFQMHTNDQGDTGFLMPTFVMRGTKQFGIELPFYWKIKDDIDLMVSRTQFVPLIGYKTREGGQEQLLKDLYNVRTSFTGLRFRHLVSTDYGFSSFYTFDGIITDKTMLVDNQKRLGQLDANGNPMYGYRWMADFRSQMQLTNTTFLNIRQLYTSDVNFLYIYKMDFRQTQTNFIHLYDVSDNHYFSAELYRYQRMLLDLDYATLPILYPVLQGEYHFKKDKLGGHFYIKGKSYYLNRVEGYSHSATALDLGYRLPYITKYGTKITFDTLARSQYDYIKLNNMTTYAIPLQTDVARALYFYYGNYANLLNTPYYSMPTNNYDKFRVLSFSKIQVEHPIVLSSFFGKTIFNPKIALRYSPNNGRNMFIPADDNLSMQMTYYNAFDLLQSDGLGIYDTGGSFIYGTEVTHKLKYNIEVNAGVAQNFRFTGDVTEQILSELSGYRRSLSDVMGNVGLRKGPFNFTSFVNYDIHRKEIRMLGASITYYTYPLFASIAFNQFSKHANFIGYKLDVATFTLTLRPIKNLRMSATIRYNLSGMVAQGGYIGPGIGFYSGSIYYKIGCLMLGFVISHNYMVISNVPSITTYRFKVTFTGFG